MSVFGKIKNSLTKLISTPQMLINFNDLFNINEKLTYFNEREGGR